jgi:predicted ATPase/class 3 adenylate cyclase
MARDLPGGTVTFLFTDVEGSTRLLHDVGTEAYAAALAEHRRLVREAFGAHGGVEVDTQGDAFFVAFPTAPGALAAAMAARDALDGGPIRLRMGLHTGTPLLTAEGYVGRDVHRAARIAAAGHGGQVLISTATAALVGKDGLRDLGEHRLKDLSAPERIYQLGDAEFPPLRSLYRTNLPIPVTPFLGREREVAEVVALLTREDVRLVTLTGPGGTGKTRLSMHAAAALGERYPDGVWWVPLAPLRDPKLVTETAGRVIGSKNGLAEHIADRSMLLIFDNFEQVVEAAVDLSVVLAMCPHLDLLATSREPLHIGGEHEYPVPPLARDEGVELFLTRARAVGADVAADETVVEICRRLDDLPLAIELAAARVKALSPAQILERLEQRLVLLTGGARDLSERQRTLRGAIDWSHDLLTPDEQVVFRRFAVFRGGCTLEAAGDVAGADLDTVQSLVDKSLLRHVDDRFRMLETIRQYAAERLQAAGETEAVQRRHAEQFVALAEAAYPNLKGDPKAWLDRLEAEHDNLRAALDRLAAAGETQLALQLAGALWKFWYQRGHIPEGRRRLEAALATDASPTASRGRALNGAGGMTAEYGDIAAARRFDEEALNLFRALGDAWGVANSVFLLGSTASLDHDWDTARQLFEESLEAFRELGDDHYVLLVTDALAGTYEELGDRERALPLHGATLDGARATGNRRMEVMALHSLAYWARLDGRIGDALTMVEKAHRINLDLGQRVEIVGDLSRFARILAAADRPEAAARLLARSQALGEELGVSRQYELERDEETLTLIRARLDEAALAEAMEAGRALTVEEAVALAMDAATR